MWFLHTIHLFSHLILCTWLIYFHMWLLAYNSFTFARFFTHDTFMLTSFFYSGFIYAHMWFFIHDSFILTCDSYVRLLYSHVWFFAHGSLIFFKNMTPYIWFIYFHMWFLTHDSLPYTRKLYTFHFSPSVFHTRFIYSHAFAYYMLFAWHICLHMCNFKPFFQPITPIIPLWMEAPLP